MSMKHQKRESNHVKKFFCNILYIYDSPATLAPPNPNIKTSPAPIIHNRPAGVPASQIKLPLTLCSTFTRPCNAGDADESDAALSRRPLTAAADVGPPTACGLPRPPSNEQLAAPGEGSDIVAGEEESSSRPLPLNDSVGDNICWCMLGCCSSADIEDW
nr:unnamed protein product [Callosobruchus chinensis]